MILEKEHIAAKATGEISTFESRPGDPEITVDQYVMDPRVRGTSRDPRALDHEQWIVKIRMIEDGRQFNIQTDPHRWTRVSIGDRIKIAYRQGKYTGTIWDAEIR